MTENDKSNNYPDCVNNKEVAELQAEVRNLKELAAGRNYQLVNIAEILVDEMTAKSVDHYIGWLFEVDGKKVEFTIRKEDGQTPSERIEILEAELVANKTTIDIQSSTLQDTKNTLKRCQLLVGEAKHTAITEAIEATREALHDGGEKWLCRVIDLEKYAHELKLNQSKNLYGESSFSSTIKILEENTSMLDKLISQRKIKSLEGQLGLEVLATEHQARLLVSSELKLKECSEELAVFKHNAIHDVVQLEIPN